MQILRPHFTAANVLEQYHTDNYESTEAWPYAMTLLAISMTNVGNPRMVSFAIKAVRSQDPLVQESILSTYEMPFNVREAIEADSFEDVEPLPIKTFNGELGLTADVSREMRVRMVEQEIDRRVLKGVTISVTDAGDIPIQGRLKDQINIIALSDTAKELIEAGYVDMQLSFKDADSVRHRLTPAQILELARKGKAAAAAIIDAGHTMLELEEIPENFTDDSHWPAQ